MESNRKKEMKYKGNKWKNKFKHLPLSFRELRIPNSLNLMFRHYFLLDVQRSPKKIKKWLFQKHDLMKNKRLT